MAKRDINYTVINHIAREELDLTWVEYGLADLVHNLSNNPQTTNRWCYASKERLASMLGVSKQYVHKMINKLIEQGLLERHEETKHLRTTQSWFDVVIIKSEDKDSKQSLPPVNKVYSDSKQSLLRDSKQSLPNNDIYNKDNNNDNLATDVAGKYINNLLYAFKALNPSYQKLFPDKTQRTAMIELVEQYGIEKMTNLLSQLPDIVQKPYAPRITTPYILQKKMGELILFMQQEKRKGGGTLDARHIK